MPALECYFWMDHDRKALNLQCRSMTDGRKPHLPTQQSKPAHNVAQQLLCVSGGELGYPVVLAS